MPVLLPGVAVVVVVLGDVVDGDDVDPDDAVEDGGAFVFPWLVVSEPGVVVAVC